MRQYAQEARAFVIDAVGKNGGHLASNLGVAELTVALHYVFDTPKDKIIWDVGHQAYIHKLITGRAEGFKLLRKEGGVSGFPRTSESAHDCFDTGHSSTAISAAVGFAHARRVIGGDYNIVAVVGDGAMTGGLAYEGLNNAGHIDGNLIIVLNDNEMSISRNVGSMSKYLNRIRTQPFYEKAKHSIEDALNKLPYVGKPVAQFLKRAKSGIKHMAIPGALFEELGFTYVGLIDGHDINELIRVLNRVKQMNSPVLLHILTKKGKGYKPAEENPGQYHGTPPFIVENPQPTQKGFSEVFGREVLLLAKANPAVTAITAAMPDGTGLAPFAARFPKRFIDVGIAEAHAVTTAAAMALGGLIPVVALYSSFLQRAYDSLLHDVALQNAHVVLAIDRAGVVGDDGETHQGLYDMAMLLPMPNFTVLAPSSSEMLTEMLRYAVETHRGPIAVRYPKSQLVTPPESGQPFELGKAAIVRQGVDVTLVSVGTMLGFSIEAAEAAKAQGVEVEVIDLRTIKPVDMDTIRRSVAKTGKAIVVEDGVAIGGIGSHIATKLAGVRVCCIGFPDAPVYQGSMARQFELYGLDSKGIAAKILDYAKG